MCTQPKQKTPAWGKREQPLLIPNKKAIRDSYKGTKPLRID